MMQRQLSLKCILQVVLYALRFWEHVMNVVKIGVYEKIPYWKKFHYCCGENVVRKVLFWVEKLSTLVFFNGKFIIN